MEKIGRYRWTMCALLFFATTINYIDRQITGILGPTLQAEFGWSETQYADITSYWTAAYAIGFLFVGRFIDRVGVRLGFAAAVVVWSIAAAAHGMVQSVFGFALARFVLGLGEAGNFPAAIKATAEWFPRHERAFSTGIFNSGSNVAAIITAILVPWITLTWGWREAFVITGSFGFVWLLFWWPMYRRPHEHPHVSAKELAYIRDGQETEAEPSKRVGWLELLRYRQTWTFLVGKFMTDGVWWFYLFWLPKFLDARYGIKLGKLALPIIVIYLVADVGSVGGGWLSGFLIKRGWPVAKARKSALLIAALLIVPTAAAPLAPTLWVAVSLVSVAAAAHQWWSANLFTTASDMFPRHAIGSVVGLGGFAGAAGGVLFQRLTGRILEATGSNYVPVFLICGSAYVTALLIIHLLAPKMEPVALRSA
ncbi:MFS transporter [Gemmatimonas sp.]|jgi:ACS family hexuronate transporter-like MFS transporter|uniref:MFS transporter n=1 Tax=Gemmatimonas sp. TaxID=1962908 RepID=UPI0037BEAD1A